MKQPDKKLFIEHAYHTSCQAHFREDFFIPDPSTHTPQEFYPELSYKQELTRFRFICEWDETEDIQGTFYFLTESASDLYFMCSYYAKIGTPYFVFFHLATKGDNNPSGWVIWLPEENFNKGNKLS